MRNETLLKIIIAVFAIILIILGTFAYGNYVRSKKSSQNQTNTQPTVNKPSETPAPAPAPSPNNTAQLPASNSATPTRPVTPTPTPPAHTPATGAAGDAVIGATVIAVGVYLLRKSKQPTLAVSRSRR